MPVQSIALIVTLGLVLGTFPIYGFPTVMCAGAALTLRLNWPALQILNQMTAPLQFALLIPYARLGARITGSPAVFHPGVFALHAVIGWGLVSIPAGIAIYCVMRVAARTQFRRSPIAPLISGLR